MKAIKPGIYKDMSNNTYHNSEGISKSGLDLIAKCPALYKDRYIDGNKSEPTSAMIIGSATHTAVFEPHLFDLEYAVAPAVDKRTKAGKAAFAAFEEESKGKHVLTADSYANIMAISNAVRTDSRVSQILKYGEAENSIFHEDEDTGELIKVRPDWMHEDLLVDLKTTVDASPDGFSKSCFNFRYHVQAAMYLDVANAAYKIHEPEFHGFNTFMFIAVEKTAPYQLAIYYADETMVELGRHEYMANFQLYCDLLGQDIYPGYNNDKIVPISLPYWAEQRIVSQ